MKIIIKLIVINKIPFCVLSFPRRARDPYTVKLTEYGTKIQTHAYLSHLQGVY